MKDSCPLKTNPDWVESEKVLGENNTWKLWMESSTGDLLPPIKGAFYFYTNQRPKDAAKLLETYIPAGLRAKFNRATRVSDMINVARADMFKDPAYLTWLKTQDYYDKFEADVQEILEKQEQEKYKDTPIEELEKVPQGADFVKIDPVDLINKIRNTEILNTLAQASISTGIDFKMMSAEEAKTELAGKYVGYNGQPLVLLLNKLIYIPENLSSTTELADLMIPFITSLRRSKKNIFNIQYNKIINSSIGPMLVERAKQNNPDASYDNEYFQELVIQEALREDANLKKLAKLSQAGAETIDPLFKEAITAIVAHARESIRSKIQGIKQTSISTNTTLEEFGTLVENAGKKFTTEGITSSDVAKYNQEIQKGVDEITTAVNNDQSLAILNNVIQNFIRTNSKQLSEIKDNIYNDIRQSLSDESGRFLRDIAERLKYFRKENADVYDYLDNSFRAKALVSSLLTLNKTLDKIFEFLNGLEGQKLSVEELAEKVAHYNYLLQSWGNFVETTRRNLKEMGVAEESTIYGFLARLDSKIEDGAAIAKKLNNNVATEHIAVLLGDFSTKQRKYYDDQIADLKKQAYSAKRDRQIKELEEKREKYNFTKDKVNQLFRGQLGDANFWSSMFESYTTNPDPVIASFALFIKGHTQDILNTAITKSTKFTEKIKPLMARRGMTNVDHKRDWEPFLMVDHKPMRREDGTLDSQKVLTFMSAVKDWRYGLAEFDDAINKAEKEGNKDALKKAIIAKEEHLNNFFNRKYKREFYEARTQLIKDNEDASKALEEVNKKIAEFRNEHKDDIDFFMNNSELDTLYKKKQRLYSIYNEDGSLKDEAGRKIAVALQNHRVRMKRFYTSEEKKGAFQRSLDGFMGMAEKSAKIKEEYKIDKYYDEEGNPSPEFKKAIDEWINQNTTVAYSDTYYEEIDKIYTELGELSKLLPEEYRTDELYKRRSDILTGFKDEYGQPNPSEMGLSKDKRMAELKSIQEQIDKIQKKADVEFFSKNPELKAKFNDAIDKLTSIKFNVPTSYYLEEINPYLAAVNGPSLTDEKTANKFLTGKDGVEKIEKYKKQYPEFAKWFDANHIKKETLSSTGKKKIIYERLYAWSVPEIEGSQYYIQTPVKIGNTTININRKPNSKYYFTKVKDTYKTIKDDADRQSKIGTVITNRNEYLPLNKEQFIEQGREAEIADSPYINHQYYAAIKDPTYKQLLDTTKEYHLSNQLGLDRDQKLYMDLPRYPISSVLEKSQRGILFTRWTDRLKSITAGIRATLGGASVEEANIASAQPEDVAEEFVNPEVEKEHQEFTMLEDGVINPVLDQIPIRGIQDLPIDRTSYDVIAGLNLYMLQTEKQKLFNKISPLAQAVMQTLDDVDGGIAKINGIKSNLSNISNAARNLTTGKDKSVRSAAFKAFFEREFKGRMYSEKHLDWLNKVTSAITGGASMNYFALNLPSAIKNYWGMLWQMNVEAVAGEYFDFGSMAKGKLRSKTAMAEWTTRIWGGTYNTIDTQMIIRFDPIQGKGEEVIGKDPSRTFQKDLASVSWVYSPRKFMEMEGGLQLFYSMMYHHKVKDENGNQTNISYADAWELKEGKMTLKKGIHPDYGITYNEDGTTTLGKEFKKFQNAVHEKFKDLNGAFAKFEQPQAQMFFAYRLFAFMRRYFTAMFMNRFGSERANFALETVRTGYYIEALQSLGKIIMSLGLHAGQLAPSERRALFKTLVDVIQIVAISAIAAMLFGWDDDDEDRFEKLRAKSGALGEDDFKLDGWLSNHALTLLLKTQAENQSFIPLPGLGLNNYIDFTSSTSIAFGPTITSGARLLTDIAQHAMPGDNEDLYYKRDTGPYSWQKEGEAKIWNHFFSMVGFSGSQVSPVKGLESFEAQSRQ